MIKENLAKIKQLKKDNENLKHLLFRHFLINHFGRDLVVGDVVERRFDDRVYRYSVVRIENCRLYIDPNDPNLAKDCFVRESAIRQIGYKLVDLAA